MLLYRLVVGLLACGIVVKLCLRRDWATLSDRLARTGPTDPGARVWVHAASNGELTSVKPVLTALLDRGVRLLITVNTQSARDMAERWSLPNTDIRLAPLDLSHVTRRMMRQWSVTGYITVESDIWPHRFLNCPGPVLLIGARLTDRTARGWARFPRFAKRVLSQVSYLSAQDSRSLARFLEIGLPDTAVGPVFDLKALYTPPPLRVPAELAQHFDRTTTWLAASTHEGEDALLLDAHKRAQADIPDLKLILAPRHPKRADAIIADLQARGLSFARRSRGETPDGVDVYLADTLGEMPLWYQLAGTTFVAGSLTNRSGHTPYEPAAFDSAIIHGPDTGNFSAAYQRLGDAKAAIEATNAVEIATAVTDLTNPARQKEFAATARHALHQDTDLDALMRDICSRLGA